MMTRLKDISIIYYVYQPEKSKLQRLTLRIRMPFFTKKKSNNSSRPHPGPYSNTCTLCTQTIGETDRAILPCGHIYCLTCIIEQYKAKNKCPCCRNKISVFSMPRPKVATDRIARNIPIAQAIPYEVQSIPNNKIFS